jgi:hypothetical protein
MESAPLGSCPNDPIQAQCGIPPARIVATSVPSGTNGSGFTTTGFGPLGSAGPSQTMAEPAASAGFYACTVGAKLNTVNNGGTAHGEGFSTCVAPVTKQYVYVDLDSFWTSTNSWHNEASGAACGGNACPVGGPWYANAYWDCNIRALRDWKALTSAFAYVGNAVYAGSGTGGPTTLDCVG